MDLTKEGMAQNQHNYYGAQGGGGQEHSYGWNIPKEKSSSNSLTNIVCFVLVCIIVYAIFKTCIAPSNVNRRQYRCVGSLLLAIINLNASTNHNMLAYYLLTFFKLIARPTMIILARMGVVDPEQIPHHQDSTLHSILVMLRMVTLVLLVHEQRLDLQEADFGLVWPPVA